MGMGIEAKFEPTRRIPAPLLVGAEEKKCYRQIYKVNSLTDEALARIKAEGGGVSLDQWNFYRDVEAVADHYRDHMEQHLDRRVQLFFTQLITVWRTPYHFEWLEANDQYGKGCHYTIKHPNNTRTRFSTVGAHSSAFPCLKAFQRNKWDSFERGEREEPKGFVFLKYGHNYVQQNGTIELPTFANQADSLIDGTHSDSRFRNAAIKIINDVAKGKCSPEKGTKRFARRLKFYIERAMELDDEDPRLLALNCYWDRLDEVRSSMRDDPDFFDQLLGVQIGEHPREAILRRVVYRKRFSLIQKCESIESKIARDILNAQNKMCGTRKKSLPVVDYRLQYVLLEDMDPVFRRALERLFCTSLKQLRANIGLNEGRIRAFEARSKIRAFRERHTDRVERLKGVLKQRFEEMGEEELNYRAYLFKDLREDLNGWRGKDFVAKFQRKFPGESMSKSMVSRMEQRTRAGYENRIYLTPLEQRRKNIEESKAKKIADTFKVDQGLFLPAVVSSVY